MSVPSQGETVGRGVTTPKKKTINKNQQSLVEWRLGRRTCTPSPVKTIETAKVRDFHSSQDEFYGKRRKARKRTSIGTWNVQEIATKAGKVYLEIGKFKYGHCLTDRQNFY